MGSALARQVARAGDGPAAHANTTKGHSHPPAALKARRPANLELHMRAAKVPVSSGVFDSECHGFQLSPGKRGTVAPDGPSRRGFVTGLAGGESVQPSHGCASSDKSEGCGHIDEGCPLQRITDRALYDSVVLRS